MTINSALIDVGGSSVKVTIRNSRAEKLLSHEIEITPSVQGGHIFLEPTELFTTIVNAMNLCASKLPVGSKVDKVYISTLRQGFCLIDSKNELTPIYLNSDTSGELARSDIAKYGSKKIYEETGHWFAPQLTLPKLINLLRGRPDLRNRKIKLLFVHDWLVWKFTRQILTEMTLVSAGQMAKISTRSINYELLEHFGLSSNIVPEPSKFGTTIGVLDSNKSTVLTAHWSEVEICVGGGDSHFLHLGASGNREGKVVVSAGSSTPISLLSRTLGSSSQLQPWKSTSFDESMYLLEGNLGYPGSFFGWLNRNLTHPISACALTIENISQAPSVFGSCNMWNEEKWESRPPFSILGDFSKSNGDELGLGLTLDYSFALFNQVSALIKDDFEVNQVIITGGGANTQLQIILESLLDLPVEIVSTDNAINNLFSLLNHENKDLTLSATNSTHLDSETSEFLRIMAVNHALLYTQVEGTRKVLENAS